MIPQSQTVNPFCAAVARGISDGYGIEDIAVQTGHHPTLLRFAMRAMAADGRLDRCIDISRYAWQEARRGKV